MTKKLACYFSLMLALSVLTALPAPARADDIFYANNHLTFREFLGAFNGDDERLKRDTIVYLYGVIDATEKNIGAVFASLNQWS